MWYEMKSCMEWDIAVVVKTSVTGRVLSCNESSPAQSSMQLDRSLCVKHTDTEIHKILHKRNSIPTPQYVLCVYAG